MKFLGFEIGKYHSASKSSSEGLSQAVATSMYQIQTAVSSFQCLVEAIGTSKDTPEFHQKLHNMRLHIGQLVVDTTVKLKALSDHDRAANVSESEKVLDLMLVRSFQTILKDFQKAQMLAQEREVSYMLLGATTSAVPCSANEDAKQDLESQPILLDQSRIVLLPPEDESLHDGAIVEERERKFKEMQYQLEDIRGIYKDLAVLNHAQPGLFNDVETKLANLDSSIAEYKPSLKIGRSIAAWQWWLLAVLIMIIMILVVWRLFNPRSSQNNYGAF